MAAAGRALRGRGCARAARRSLGPRRSHRPPLLRAVASPALGADNDRDRPGESSGSITRDDQWDWAAGERREEQHYEPIPVPVGVADDVNVHNPLERLNRLSTGWMGAIMEYEGVVVQGRSQCHEEAWQRLAEEEGKSAPLGWQMRRVVNMKPAQAITDVLHWSRNPSEVQRLAMRKAALFREAVGEEHTVALPGVEGFLLHLRTSGVPIALCSTTQSVQQMEAGLSEVGFEAYFDVVADGGDAAVCQPEPDLYQWCASQLTRTPHRCVVFGAHNSSIEAAHAGSMKCVAVSGAGVPAYELGSADGVVRRLDELKFTNLKNLFSRETEEGHVEMVQLEREPFFREDGPAVGTAMEEMEYE
mmetsp:Transcript_720/g.2348  ORF Transcript_720/g.2348 Transcript_720/m.2348 type:complete len:360 (-) Transcript_720:225-1304(-)